LPFIRPCQKKLTGVHRAGVDCVARWSRGDPCDARINSGANAGVNSGVNSGAQFRGPIQGPNSGAQFRGLARLRGRVCAEDHRPSVVPAGAFACASDADAGAASISGSILVSSLHPRSSRRPRLGGCGETCRLRPARAGNSWNDGAPPATPRQRCDRNGPSRREDGENRLPTMNCGNWQSSIKPRA
jgi:hypothetical protein